MTKFEILSAEGPILCPFCKKSTCGATEDCGWKFRKLLFQQKQFGIESLSVEERTLLLQYGNHCLMEEKDVFDALSIFKSIQSFEGVQKIIDFIFLNYSGDKYRYKLFDALQFIEDYEGIRDVLNSIKSHFLLHDFPSHLFLDTFGEASKKYRAEFLEHNATPVATGGSNGLLDYVAIYNLKKLYDIAVPIARGGLIQGAMASFWGMPTRIVDIAAHNRKTPKGKWINPVVPEDFHGKRVLLFDKDAVSGASIRKTVQMLSKFHSASIGVYFTHNILPRGSQIGELGTHVEGLPENVEVFGPNTAPLENAGDVYMELHEKFKTLYGQRRIIEREYIQEIIPDTEKQYPFLADALKGFLSRHLNAFDSLNPLLPGIEKERERILSKLKSMSKQHQENMAHDLYSFLSGTLENFIQILITTQPFQPIDFAQTLIFARYQKKAEEMAQKRGIENPHIPADRLAAFHMARKAVEDGFDIALIVGPEGFAYEPYFQDLGMPTLALNIPESKSNEPRSITFSDDLSVLQGKKVLVVEDDVRSGATLQKILEILPSHHPATMGLYLGLSKHYHRETNIPAGFQKTYIAGDNSTPEAEAKEFCEFLASKGLRIFKNPETTLRL